MSNLRGRKKLIRDILRVRKKKDITKNRRMWQRGVEGKLIERNNRKRYDAYRNRLQEPDF